MNVFFDYQIFYLQKYGGISRYFYELAKELEQITDCKPRIVAPFHTNHYLSEKKDAFTISLNPRFKNILGNRLSGKQLLVNERLMQWLSSRGEKTVLHETYYTNRFKVKVPRVTTIHDMIYELYHNNSPEEKQVISLKKKAVQEADWIIAVSENTKKDLLDIYPEAKNKTSVVYHGVDQFSHPQSKPYQNNRPFFLYVGNRGWYKNFEILLEVFGVDKNVNANVDLICFGGGPVTDRESKLLSTYKIKEKVKFLSGNDDLLISLYQSAKALVYISSYEGFGMPVLEAMALSCPVVCSNTSSLPEVYGNAAYAVDPMNRSDISRGLHALLFDLDLRTKFVNLGLQRVSLFTWKKCAESTFDIYKSLI